jgi:hypothetical protein
MEEDSLSLGSLSDFMDHTIENLAGTGHLLRGRREVTKTEFFGGFMQMARHRLSISLMFFNMSRILSWFKFLDWVNSGHTGESKLRWSEFTRR